MGCFQELEKYDSPSPISHPLQYFLGWGETSQSPLPSMLGFLSGLTLSVMAAVNSHVQWLCCAWETSSLKLPTISGSYNRSTPSSVMIPSLERKGCTIDGLLLMAEHSKVSLSLLTDELGAGCLCVKSTSTTKRSFFDRIKTCTNPWAKR